MSFRCLAAKSVTRFLAASALARCGRAGAVVNDVWLAVGYNITLSVAGTAVLMQSGTLQNVQPE